MAEHYMRDVGVQETGNEKRGKRGEAGREARGREGREDGLFQNRRNEFVVVLAPENARRVGEGCAVVERESAEVVEGEKRGEARDDVANEVVGGKDGKTKQIGIEHEARIIEGGHRSSSYFC